MATTTIQSGNSIASFGDSFMPSYSDAADIQTALKALYFGSTGAPVSTSGIYGALYTLYTGNPTLAGNVTITGDLTVNGNTTTINVANLLVEDKEIVIGNVSSPSNATADGGGIRLEAGASDKTILWDVTNQNWTTSENWNIASGKTLKINNVTLLDTNAPKSMATLMGYTTTATAGGSTTLTATSSYYQQFTGTLTQTVVLPVTSTLITGWTFHIVNNSTGNLTVNSSGGNLVITVIPGTTAMVTCIGTALTTAADWEAGLTDFSTYTGTSGSVVMSGSPSITSATLTTPTIGSGGANFSGSSSGTTNVQASATASGTLTLPASTGTLALTTDIPAATKIQFFGDGSDGNVTITTPTSLDRDRFYNNLTISGATGLLQTNGYRVFVAGTLDVTAAVAGAISHNNSNGAAASGANGSSNSGGAGGSESTAGPLAGISGTAGGSGFVNSPSPGADGGSYANTTSVFPFLAYNSQSVGTSGTPGISVPFGAGGNGGGHTAPTLVFGGRRAWIDWTPLAAGKLLSSAPGLGGGAGGGQTSGTAGGGGGGGASCYALAIYANIINRGAGTGTAFINMVGGNGGNGVQSTGSAGSGGAGSGGGGGFIYIVYGALTGSSKAGAIRSAGGTGGVHGSSSTQGARGGPAGAITLINLSTGVISYTGTVNGATGTVGAGGAGGISSVAL